MTLTPMITAATVAFWALAPLMIIFAIGLVLSRKPVHSALSLAGEMMCLAVLYASLEAPFLFVAQIIVYTGSIMMLFLFTMMLIGVDSVEDVQETLKGHRPAAFVAGGALIVLLMLTVGDGLLTEPQGLAEANATHGGNMEGLAYLIFGRYVLVFEAAALLVIVGALAAMVLAHTERLTPKERQRQRMERRMRDYASRGAHPGPRPSGGVFARHNSVDYPALLPDGSIAPSSVSATLESRDMAIVEAGDLKRPALTAYLEMAEVTTDLFGVTQDSVPNAEAESGRPPASETGAGVVE